MDKMYTNVILNSNQKQPLNKYLYLYIGQMFGPKPLVYL